MFRLLVADTLGFMGDALTPTDITNEGVLKTDVVERAEIRTDAIAVNLNRFKIDREIGTEQYRTRVESELLAEFALD